MMEPRRKLSDDEARVVEAFLRILDDQDFQDLANAFPQTTGRPASPLREPIEAERSRRRLRGT
jgi:hypothetical protein